MNFDYTNTADMQEALNAKVDETDLIRELATKKSPEFKLTEINRFYQTQNALEDITVEKTLMGAVNGVEVSYVVPVTLMDILDERYATSVSVNETNTNVADSITNLPWIK
jgi:hypothetical protein